MNSTARLEIVKTVDHVSAVIASSIQSRVAALAADDHDVDAPREWHTHSMVPWETGWLAKLPLPAIYVHPCTRGLATSGDGRLQPAGPDLNVGFHIRSHPDNIVAASRLAAYVVEALCDIARENDYAPHVHNFAWLGRPDSVDWGMAGTVLFGLMDGAPDGGG